ATSAMRRNARQRPQLRVAGAGVRLEQDLEAALKAFLGDCVRPGDDELGLARCGVGDGALLPLRPGDAVESSALERPRHRNPAGIHPAAEAIPFSEAWPAEQIPPVVGGNQELEA